MQSDAHREDRAADGEHTVPVFSAIIAASNEEHYIGPCLSSLLAQTAEAGPMDIIVAANGCNDGTEAVVRQFEARAAARDWQLILMSHPDPGKIEALNRADAVARPGPRVYVDADILCDPDLVGQLRHALARGTAAYATGRLQVAPAKSWVTRRYAEFWTRMPFVTGGAVGTGLFAVNAAGRARWDQFPPVISDDTFVRLQFTLEERIEVPAAYHWPMVEGFLNLVRVRRRQNAGVAEVHRNWPTLRDNEGKPVLAARQLAGLALCSPISFAVYTLVAIAVRLSRPSQEWSRGR